jgi:sterol desaturase/sphingolipid hydroxylase (fatty acid hydroxylase superfamily)
MATTTLTEPEALYDQPPVTYKLRATSKWVSKSFKQRNIWEHIAAIDIASKKCYEVQPKNPNSPPIHNIWIERVFLICTISPALIIQALWYHFIPEDNYYHTWHPLATYLFYFLAFFAFTVMLVKHIHYYMDLYGTFDEDKRPRDYVPDKMVTRLVISVIIYMFARTGGGLILGGYDRNAPPSLGQTISWFFIIKIGLWLIALDLFFYCYHRACHTVPFLWKIHSLHHCTKHPTPIQSILAGDVQELIEIFLIPLGASLVIPLTSHEFWIAQCILMHVEATGHSGIRAYWPNVILNEVLQPFGMELCIEDHDLHHRYGKSGMNYGKQTRIFDRIFGTLGERVECIQKRGGWKGPQ